MSAPRRKGAPAARKGAEALDPFQIVSADFVAGAGPSSELPAPAMAEVAFAGRSNVGKSSLINTLVERKGLVRTSATPGSTRQINLYEARARDGAVFHLVDLPGYGFTKRSKAEQADWAAMIERYLRTRVTLAAVLLLVDVRRGLEEDDLELVSFVAGAREAARRPVEVILVATKLDKVARSAQKSALDKAAAQIRAAGGGRNAIGFSSVTGEGKRALWRAIRRATLGEAAVGAEAGARAEAGAGAGAGAGAEAGAEAGVRDAGADGDATASRGDPGDARGEGSQKTPERAPQND